MKKISVLLLSYNHKKYISQSIDSVIDLSLNSKFSIEFIIIDDGSDDGTIDILKQYQENTYGNLDFRVILKEHQGIGAISNNFNEMVAMSTGDYISFLASDDSYCKDRFDKQIIEFEKNKNLFLVYGNGINVIEGVEGKAVHNEKVTSLLKTKDAQKLYNYVTTDTPMLFIQSVLVKGDFIRSYEPFDNSLIADDWVFNIRIFDKLMTNGGTFGYVDEVCFYRNHHSTNTSKDVINHYLRIEEVVDRYFSQENKIKIKSERLSKILTRGIKKLKWNYVSFAIGKILDNKGVLSKMFSFKAR